MKLRDLAYLLGLRPRPQKYGWHVERYELPREGCVEFAQWEHPLQKPTVPTQEMIDQLRTFLREGDFAIDVGAQVGDTTVPMAFAVGRSGCVLALEPNAYVFPVLEENAQLNRHRTHIEPLMAAAAAEAGEQEFEYSDAGFCNGGFHEGISRWRHGHAFKLKVQAIQLESLLRSTYADRLPRLKYIKTDCEGYDLSVLKSLQTLLRERRPYLKVEVYKHSTLEYRRDLLSFLRGLGYRTHRVASESQYRGEIVGPHDVQRWSHYDLFCVPVNTE
jgi:FkbM family methyltransferase